MACSCCNRRFAAPAPSSANRFGHEWVGTRKFMEGPDRFGLGFDRRVDDLSRVGIELAETARAMGSSPEPAVPAYSSLRMARKRPRVLGAAEYF
jgi:hypothetical protein